MKNFGQSCLIGHAWAIILAKGTHSLSCQFSLLNFPYLSFSDWHTSALRQLEYLSNIPWKSSTTRTASQSLSQTGWTYLKTSSESWTIDRKYKIVPCSSIWGKNWREKNNKCVKWKNVMSIRNRCNKKKKKKHHSFLSAFPTHHFNLFVFVKKISNNRK